MAEPGRAAARETGLGYAADFKTALLDPKHRTPSSVTGPRGKAAGKRYNVYRNNVTASLIDALADIFPATLRIVGDEFFRAMARIHVRQSPPTSPLLFEYGRDFADFIERFEHARDLRYLADVARIERAWLDAYHAADATPLRPDALAAIPPEHLGAAGFVGHPATRIVRSRHPAVTIFAANRSTEEVGRIETAEPEDALVTRPGLDVVVRKLPPGTAAFLSGLMAGKTLAEAAAAGLDDSPNFDLATGIAGMIVAGVFAEVAAQEPGKRKRKYDR